MRFRVTRSGASFSPWDMSKAIASSIRDFAFDVLLMRAIATEKEHDGEGTEGDPSDGTGFEEVRDPAISTQASARSTVPSRPASSNPASGAPPIARNTPHANTAHSFGDSSDSEPSSDGDTSTPGSRKRKQKSKSKVAYKKLMFKRRRAADRQGSKDDIRVKVRPSMRERHIASSTPINVPSFGLDMQTPAKTGYVGTRDPKASKKVYTLWEMVGMGSKFNFNLVEWDGRVSCPIIDKAGRVIAALCGHPDDPDWESVHVEAADTMRRAQRRIHRTKKNSKHRRGHFTALASGVSFGGGQKVPGNLVNTPRNTIILDEILESTAFVRLARFANSCFATWAPKLFTYYLEHVTSLFDWYGARLRRNFATVFTCATFNFGPSTVSFTHTDPGNLPYGWCSITSLGPFDPKCGGHLVLWDLQLVVEFPPGSTIMIPSAVLRHSNTVIQKGEGRYSFTQYTAGGLFRWVDHGFQKEAGYFSSLSKEEAAEEEESMQHRWEKGLGLFSTLDELKNPCK